MHGLLRMVAVVLLLTMAAMPGAQAMPFPAVEAAHPAGCHGQGPATPVPSPTNYQCCANGHQAAMPNAAFSIGLMVAQICSLEHCDGAGLRFVSLPSAVFVVPSNSPPGAVPLRI
ncbi:MAG TPA: hypothetical protein VIX37_10375 [Candidatus Sulfotelmatobacter sp.]